MCSIPGYLYKLDLLMLIDHAYTAHIQQCHL